MLTVTRRCHRTRAATAAHPPPSAATAPTAMTLSAPLPLSDHPGPLMDDRGTRLPARPSARAVSSSVGPGALRASPRPIPTAAESATRFFTGPLLGLPRAQGTPRHGVGHP